MMKTIKTMMAQDKERYKVPRRVQDIIPISCMWPDGIFKVGNRFTKTFRFTDINYLVAARDDQQNMFLIYSELLNSFDSGATYKITGNNNFMSVANFEDSNLMPMQDDWRDVFRIEYNDMLVDKATNSNGILQDKFVTVSVAKKTVQEARTYFSRFGAELQAHFAALGSKCSDMTATERLRVLHDFYRSGDRKSVV